MYEIEIKFKFKSKNVAEAEERLKSLNLKWNLPITQKDRIFLSKTMKEYKIVEGTQILRIREEIKNEVCLKKVLTMKIQQKNALESREFESKIDDTEQIKSIIEELGFNEFVCVEKTRKKSQFNQYNLCLDEVKGLGVFLEIEFLSQEKVNALEIQQEMINWVRTLELGDFEISKIPYDTQIYLKSLGLVAKQH